MQFKHYRLLRLWGMFKKEWTLILRDYRTYAFVLITPFFEAILFGLIIDFDAKNLPTIVVSKDNTEITQSIIQTFKNTGYFAIKDVLQDEKKAETLMKRGDVKFILHIPESFTKELIRGEKPSILLEGDASDPVAINNAFRSTSTIANRALDGLNKGALEYLSPEKNSFQINTQAKYNAAITAQYHTLPGLLSSILTISLALVMAISITGEYESGTMEMLLITPVNPLEVIIGKILPNIFLGYILFFLLVAVATLLFRVPFRGSLLLLSLAALPFIIANLSLGIATSCIAKNQFQATQIAGSYTLPSVLLSGFLFPRDSMPTWAQWLSSLFPNSYFLEITSNVMLKEANFIDILPQLIPIIIFAISFIFISYKFYRKTLD